MNPLNDITEAFNNALKAYEQSQLNRHYIFQLGNPSSILLAASFPNLGIQMAQSIVTKAVNKHGIAVTDLTDLPFYIAEPLFIFDSLTVPHSKVVITELIVNKQHSVTIAFELNKQKDKISINDIRSIYGKDIDSIVYWLEDISKPLLYANKEKIQHWLCVVLPNLARHKSILDML